MVFIRDTEMSLRAGAALVNTLRNVSFDETDTLMSTDDLDLYLAEYPFTGRIRRDEV